MARATVDYRCPGYPPFVEQAARDLGIEDQAFIQGVMGSARRLHHAAEAAAAAHGKPPAVARQGLDRITARHRAAMLELAAITLIQEELTDAIEEAEARQAEHDAALQRQRSRQQAAQPPEPPPEGDTPGDTHPPAEGPQDPARGPEGHAHQPTPEDTPEGTPEPEPDDQDADQDAPRGSTAPPEEPSMFNGREPDPEHDRNRPGAHEPRDPEQDGERKARRRDRGRHSKGR